MPLNVNPSPSGGQGSWTTVFKGDSSMNVRRDTVRWDPTRGYSELIDYRGLSQQSALDLFQTYIGLGVACEVVYEDDIAEVHINNSTQEITIDSWEIVGDEAQSDFLLHPTMLSNLALEDIQELRQYLNDGLTSNQVFIMADWEDLQDTAIERIYAAVFNGQTEYLKQQYVLRHETSLSGRSKENIADVGVNQIYTIASLLSEVQDSSLWAFPLPERLAYKISNILPPYVPYGYSAPQNYVWGAFKSTSTESTVVNNRIQIRTDYTIDLINADAYATYAGSGGF
jgi:hypothetical protein